MKTLGKSGTYVIYASTSPELCIPILHKFSELGTYTVLSWIGPSVAVLQYVMYFQFSGRRHIFHNVPCVVQATQAGCSSK